MDWTRVDFWLMDKIQGQTVTAFLLTYFQIDGGLASWEDSDMNTSYFREI